MFREVKHSVIPIFGFLANGVCMLFYLVGPFTVDGMSWKESYVALGIAAIWGIYGIFYFKGASKLRNKPILLDHPEPGGPTGTATPLVVVQGQGNGGVSTSSTGPGV